jgi:hypothetical protein
MRSRVSPSADRVRARKLYRHISRQSDDSQGTDAPFIVSAALDQGQQHFASSERAVLRDRYAEEDR